MDPYNIDCTILNRDKLPAGRRARIGNEIQRQERLDSVNRDKPGVRAYVDGKRIGIGHTLLVGLVESLSNRFTIHLEIPSWIRIILSIVAARVVFKRYAIFPAASDDPTEMEGPVDVAIQPRFVVANSLRA